MLLMMLYCSHMKALLMEYAEKTKSIAQRRLYSLVSIRGKSRVPFRGEGSADTSRGITYLIPRDSNGGGSGDLIGAKPDGCYGRGHPQDEHLAKGGHELAERLAHCLLEDRQRDPHLAPRCSSSGFTSLSGVFTLSVLTMQVGVEVTTGVLRGSRSLETDLYSVSQSDTPRELLRSMSGTERAASIGALSSRLDMSLSRSPSLMPRDGSRSQALISALAHSRMSELPDMAVDGSLGMSMASWREMPSWPPPCSGSLSSLPGLLGGRLLSGSSVGTSWNMASSSSDI
ncbi:hypothetical protein CRUP_026893 [Coryphaenoides rupestris]|nr:hypothetical protein CRUP_026893 [Coryphaenoides rupestris]